ncbi:hypothetical protein pipiens_013435 [Culex pipiens pipiens]|uniref:Uncharacterized protein n=1 Tax=Culex pipiens pipiens TaxID=38569 RepID=A0ABD1CYW9_CULPP
MPLTLACIFLPSRTNTNVRCHFRSDTQKSVRDSFRRVRSCTSTTCAFVTFDNACAGKFGAVIKRFAHAGRRFGREGRPKYSVAQKRTRLGHGTPGANSARLWFSAACSHGTSGAKAARLFGGTSGAKAARPCSSAEHPAQTPLALGVRRRERSEGGGTLQSGAGLGHGTPGANSARLWVSSACSHGTSGAKAARPCSSAEHPAQRPLARAVRRNIRRKLRSPLAFGGGKGQKEEVHYNLVQDLATEHPEQTPLACGFRRRVATEHPAQRPLARAVRRNIRRKGRSPVQFGGTSGANSARPWRSAAGKVRRRRYITIWCRTWPRNTRRKLRSPVGFVGV